MVSGVDGSEVSVSTRRVVLCGGVGIGGGVDCGVRGCRWRCGW